MNSILLKKMPTANRKMWDKLCKDRVKIYASNLAWKFPLKKKFILNKYQEGYFANIVYIIGRNFHNSIIYVSGYIFLYLYVTNHHKHR